MEKFNNSSGDEGEYSCELRNSDLKFFFRAPLKRVANLSEQELNSLVEQRHLEKETVRALTGEVVIFSRLYFFFLQNVNHSSRCSFSLYILKISYLGSTKKWESNFFVMRQLLLVYLSPFLIRQQYLRLEF